MHIHWHEGLFLLPQHLQRFQRGVIESQQRERRITWGYPYGVIESRLSKDDLENGRVRFESLRAIMPSGVEVNFPDHTELASIDIREAFEDVENSNGVTIYLAVPLWFRARPNTVVENGSAIPSKVLYRVVETEWPDENSGTDSRPILERRVNAQLIVGEPNRTDLDVIPLLQVTRNTGEEVGLPRQALEFSGPALILNGSGNLREMVRNLAGQVQASRQELLIQLNRGGFSLENVRGMQFEQMMRLQALNRATARLETLLLTPAVPTVDAYLLIRELLGDLSALHPTKDYALTQPYDHDNPYPPFRETCQRIRLLLNGNVAPNFLKVNFVDKEGILTADLEADHFTKPNDYFLGIRTNEDPLALTRLVENEDRFKLMPASLANRAVRGMALKEERLPPLELPAQSGLFYFRLLRSECLDIWKMIEKEKSAVVRWTGYDATDSHVALYMTVPPNS